MSGKRSALEWRDHRANLPERWSLETFPFVRQPGVNRKQMRTFAELDFVAKHENLVLVSDRRGQSGFRLRPPAEGFFAECYHRCRLRLGRTCSTKCMPHWRTDPRASC